MNATLHVQKGSDNRASHQAGTNLAGFERPSPESFEANPTMTILRPRLGMPLS